MEVKRALRWKLIMVNSRNSSNIKKCKRNSLRKESESERDREMKKKAFINCARGNITRLN